jgi:hypothetical protein
MQRESKSIDLYENLIIYNVKIDSLRRLSPQGTVACLLLIIFRIWWQPH